MPTDPIYQCMVCQTTSAQKQNNWCMEKVGAGSLVGRGRFELPTNWLKASCSTD